MIMTLGDRRSRKRNQTAYIYAVGPLAQYPFARALQALAVFAGQAQNNAGLELYSQFFAPMQYLCVLLDSCTLTDIGLDSIVSAFYTSQDFDQTTLGHLTQIIQPTLVRDNIRS